jgi:transmembrane sensor
VDELILLALQRRATARQLEELEAWRRASPVHEARYAELSALLRLADLHVEIDDARVVPTADAVLRDVRRPRRRGRGVVGRLVGAATLAAAVAAGILIGSALATEPAAVREAVFHTDPGDMASAVLDDGTVLRMAPDTRLRVLLGESTRDVFLEGRAFFAVARDPSRPFRVHTADGQATVLGTRFEVDTRADGFRLLVVDGRVAVSRGAQALELRAGELGQARRDGPASVTRVADPEALLGWMGAFVAFESTPLHQVARELGVQLGIRIEIADPAIRDRTVTAWFGKDDRDEIIRVVCRTADVECERSGGVVRMRGRPGGRGT